MGFEYIVTPGGRWNTVPWMSWSPKGDRLAYFVRTEKERTLIIQNVLTRKIEERIADEDGRRARVAGLLAGRQDDRVRGAAAAASATSSRSTSRRKEITNLTNDDFADYGADLLARRQVHRLHRARQRQREAVPARSRHQEEDAADVRHARRRRRRSSSTTTRWCSRRPRPIRREPIEPESRGTATSTTSGRST